MKITSIENAYVNAWDHYYYNGHRLGDIDDLIFQDWGAREIAGTVEFKDELTFTMFMLKWVE